MIPTNETTLVKAMTNTNPLFQIDIQLPQAALEAVANRVMELGQSGVQWDDDKTPCILTTYVYGEKNTESLIQKVQDYLEAVESLFSPEKLGPIKKIQIDSEEWAHAWKKYFKPVRVTELLIVKPTWESYISEGDEIVLEIDPEMAFGTGTHETTSLCIQALENFSKSSSNFAGSHILDIGTGTGILSIAAIKYGAGRTAGIDVDPIAIETAQKNAELNKVSQQCDFSSQSLQELEKTFSLIVANINSDTLIALAPDIAGHNQKGGTLILSGIVNERVDDVKAAFQAQGYTDFHHEIKNEWSSLQATFTGNKV